MCSFFTFLTKCSFSSVSWKERELKEEKSRNTFKSNIKLITLQFKTLSQKLYYIFPKPQKHLKGKWQEKQLSSNSMNIWLQQSFFNRYLLKVSNVTSEFIKEHRELVLHLKLITEGQSIQVILVNDKHQLCNHDGVYFWFNYTRDKKTSHTGWTSCMHVCWTLPSSMQSDRKSVV